MPTQKTARRKLPYPELADPPNGPAAIQALAEGVEATYKTGSVLPGTANEGDEFKLTGSGPQAGLIFKRTAFGWEVLNPLGYEKLSESGPAGGVLTIPVPGSPNQSNQYRVQANLRSASTADADACSIVFNGVTDGADWHWVNHAIVPQSADPTPNVTDTTQARNGGQNLYVGSVRASAIAALGSSLLEMLISAPVSGGHRVVQTRLTTLFSFGVGEWRTSGVWRRGDQLSSITIQTGGAQWTTASRVLLYGIR